MDSTLIMSLGLGLSLLVIIVGVISQRRERDVSARLQRYAHATPTLEEMELHQPFLERAVWPIVRRLSTIVTKATPKSQADTAKKNLMMAGKNRMTVGEFQVRRFALALALGGGFSFLGGLMDIESMMRITLTMSLAALGYMMPGVWLGKAIKARQVAIQRALPDAIDLLTVCVEAGAGFDSAVAKVVSKWGGPLAQELERLLADLRMGRARREALHDLADRTGVLDVQSFVSSLIQADQLGLGLVAVLRVQAEQMRQRRRLRAEETAAKAPIKMLLPLIFCIFPAMYIIILGPAALSLMKTFGGG